MNKKTLKPEDRFLLNLDDDPITTVFSEGDFEFSITMPSLFREASLSLDTLEVAKKMLKSTDYEPLLDTIKYPKVELDTENKDAKGNLQTKVVMEDVKLDDITHLTYVLDLLPRVFRTTLSTICYINMFVSGITYKEQQIKVKVNNEIKNIDTFLDFVLYVKNRNLSVNSVIESLYDKIYNWLQETELSATEVKN